MLLFREAFAQCRADIIGIDLSRRVGPKYRAVAIKNPADPVITSGKAGMCVGQYVLQKCQF